MSLLGNRLLFTAAACALLAGPAQAQRLDVDPARATSYEKPIPTRPGELIASDISDHDFRIGPEYFAEHFVFSGRAGETLTAQVRSDVPTLEVLFREKGYNGRVLARGPAKDTPVSAVLPKDGDYYLVVAAKGPQRQGAYLLALGVADAAPPLEARTPAPARIADAPAQHVEVDPARKTSREAPIAIRTSGTIASEISETDASPMPLFREEHFRFAGQAGETITAQAATDIQLLNVILLDANGREIARGMVSHSPVKLTLPRAGDYLMVVQSGGSRRYGKYELSLKSSVAPVRAPAPVQVAEAPKPAPAPKPAGPLAPPKLPAIPGVVAIHADQTVARPAGKAGPGTETFMFLAGAGARLRAVATGSGPIDLRLYTPEGAEMLSADGRAIVALEAIAPIDGLYFLSVARKDAAKPYKLAFTAKEADVFAADFAESVGYAILGDNGAVEHVSCWLVPGVKVRQRTVSGVEAVYTLLGAGGGRFDGVRNGQAISATWKTHAEGNEFVRVYDGTGRSQRYTPFTTRRGAYKGYLCQ